MNEQSVLDYQTARYAAAALPGVIEAMKQLGVHTPEQIAVKAFEIGAACAKRARKLEAGR
jgi:chemotaxis receptor (MCP) glutamine deamidase CheD